MYITMNETKILEHNQRYCINDKEKCYFIGKDLCVAMDYKNHNAILKKYVSDENKQKFNIATNKGVQTATLLNENGVLELLNHSCKPYAQKFKELLSQKSFIQIIKGYQEVSNVKDKGDTQEVHESPVPATDLYEFSESDKPFTEWLLQATLYYAYQKDYFVNENEDVFFRNEIAKEIMIQQDNAKGKMYRQSLIAAEKERNEMKKELHNNNERLVSSLDVAKEINVNVSIIHNTIHEFFDYNSNIATNYFYQENEHYLMNKNGYMLLTMALNDNLSLQNKLKIIKNFNAMEKELHSMNSLNTINNRVQQATEYIEHNQRGIKGYI